MEKTHVFSEATIRRIWKQHNLKTHLLKTFKLSRDKHFVQKLYDVVGLYQSSRQIVGLVRGREEPNPNPGSNSTRVTYEEEPMWNHDALLETLRDDHFICGPQHARRQSDRRLHAPPSASGVYPFPIVNQVF